MAGHGRATYIETGTEHPIQREGDVLAAVA